MAGILLVDGENLTGDSRYWENPDPSIRPVVEFKSCIVVSGKWRLWQTENYEGTQVNNNLVLEHDGGPNDDGVYPTIVTGGNKTGSLELIEE